MKLSSFRLNWADWLVLMGLGGAIAGIGFQHSQVTAGGISISLSAGWLSIRRNQSHESQYMTEYQNNTKTIIQFLQTNLDEIKETLSNEDERIFQKLQKTQKSDTKPIENLITLGVKQLRSDIFKYFHHNNSVHSYNSQEEALKKIHYLCDRFDHFTSDCKNKLSQHCKLFFNEHGDKVDVHYLDVKNEYDMQYIFKKLLILLFDNVQEEVYIPTISDSYGTRLDFFLPDYGIGIELKCMLTINKEKDLIEQVGADIQQYKPLKKCEKLIFFIYNPIPSKIKNPQALEANINGKQGENTFDVEMIIRPKKHGQKNIHL